MLHCSTGRSLQVVQTLHLHTHHGHMSHTRHDHMSHTHTHPSFTDVTRPSAAANTTALALQLLQQRQLHAVIHIGDIA